MFVVRGQLYDKTSDEPLFISSPEFEESEQLELRDYFAENRLELFKEHGIIISSSADKKKSLLTKNLNFGIVKKLQLLARIRVVFE